MDQSNHLLVNGRSYLFTFSLERDSNFQSINKRFYSAPLLKKEITKFFKTIQQYYSRAPHYQSVIRLLDNIFSCSDRNVAVFNIHSVKCISEYLRMTTEFLVSSDMEVEPDVKGEQRIITLVQSLKAATYINPIGGQKLYSQAAFARYGINLFFLQPNDITYPQFAPPFQSNLSILDVLMFNSVRANSHISRTIYIGGKWIEG